MPPVELESLGFLFYLSKMKALMYCHPFGMRISSIQTQKGLIKVPHDSGK